MINLGYRVLDKKVNLQCEQNSASDSRVEFSYRKSNSGNLTKYDINIFVKDENIIPFVSAKNIGNADSFTVPAVNYNGNSTPTFFDAPKNDRKQILIDGSEYDGKKWIYNGERTTIPSCTISYDSKSVFALFSNYDGQKTGIAVDREEEKYNHYIYFGEIVEPVSFLHKLNFADAKFIPCKKGHYKKQIYVLSDSLQENESPFEKVFDFALHEFAKISKAKLEKEEVYRLGFEFTKSLFDKKRNLFEYGFLPNGEHIRDYENNDFKYRNKNKYEIGWCGQNFGLARIFVYDYVKTKNEENLSCGVNVIDKWISYQNDLGLFPVKLQDDGITPNNNVDIINCSHALIDILYCYNILFAEGIQKDSWLDFVKNAIKCYINVYKKQKVIPKIIDYSTGNIIDGSSCVGCGITYPAVMLYKITNDKQYLDFAIEVYNKYYEYYGKNDIYFGAALDTNCVDKEGSELFIKTALALYEITCDKKYLGYAKRSLYYFISYMYTYNIEFKKRSYSYKTLGATVVSAQHQHLDCWGVAIIPELLKLYEIEKKEKYINYSKILYNFTVQLISDGKNHIGDRICPVGSQSESFYHTDWSQTGSYEKGEVNDWKVAWPCVFRMKTIQETDLKFLKNN